MNLYAYVRNDPLNGTDPTGEFGLIGAVVGSFVGGGNQAYKLYSEARGSGLTHDEAVAYVGSNFGSVAREAFVGGVFGAFGGAGTTFIKAGVTGTLKSAFGTVQVTGIAGRVGAGSLGITLNGAGAIGFNALEAERNPEIDLAVEITSETVIKSVGDVGTALTGIPGIGAGAVGAKDFLEDQFNPDGRPPTNSASGGGRHLTGSISPWNSEDSIGRCDMFGCNAPLVLR